MPARPYTPRTPKTSTNNLFRPESSSANEMNVLRFYTTRFAKLQRGEVNPPAGSSLLALMAVAIEPVCGLIHSFIRRNHRRPRIAADGAA